MLPLLVITFFMVLLVTETLIMVEVAHCMLFISSDVPFESVLSDIGCVKNVRAEGEGCSTDMYN